MKREDLQKIEGLSKEQIDLIMNLHQADVTTWNKKIDDQKAIVKERDTTITELTEKVKKFDGVDVAKLQQDVKDWESKYNTDIANKDKEFAKTLLFNGYQFSSELVKKAAMQAFDEKELKFENGKFLGADDFFKGLKESDPGIFKEEQQQKKKTGFEHGGNPPEDDDDPVTRRFKELNPDIKI